MGMAETCYNIKSKRWKKKNKNISNTLLGAMCHRFKIQDDFRKVLLDEAENQKSFSDRLEVRLEKKLAT